MVVTRKTSKQKPNTSVVNNIKNFIKIRRHTSYGYCSVPTRKVKISKKLNDKISSPITEKYPRIFPDGHLEVMNIKENNDQYEQSTPQKPLLRNVNESKIEWLARISKNHPTLEIKITGDNNDFFPSFQLKAIRVFKEYPDDIMGCIQLFNNQKPLSVTFYSPEQLMIKLI